MWDYTKKVYDHFLNPRNVGDMENPDAYAEVGNMACGDALTLMLKIDKKTNIITDAKFKTFGCASAIASSSVLTELLIGKTIEQARKITNQDIAERLGGLPKEKMHCSVMGQEALEKALAQYFGEEIPEDHTELEGVIVCKCFGVTDSQIAKVVRENNLHTVGDVTNYCKAGGGCGQCHPEIEDIIRQVHGGVRVEPEKPVGQKKVMTNIEKILLIQKTIEQEIRPQMEADGGGIDLIDVVGNKVLVALRGTCVGCRTAQFTLKHAVESKLRELVDEDIFVEEVK
ncbi:MAG: Fe-S cluster assembly protein NifU [Candidatus Auribacterota bacterium]|jgi:NifU-like protein|nr:Fe-S cluster assembly protein NifU [Candidatus Auribacterota bacterium]